MYACSNQRYYSYVQANWQYERNCPQAWYFSMDSISVGTARQNIFSSLHQMEGPGEKVYQTSRSVLQTLLISSIRNHPFKRDKTCWSKQTCETNLYSRIISDNTPIPKEARTGSKTTQLQKTIIPKW